MQKHTQSSSNPVISGPGTEGFNQKKKREEPRTCRSKEQGVINDKLDYSGNLSPFALSFSFSASASFNPGYVDQAIPKMIMDNHHEITILLQRVLWEIRRPTSSRAMIKFFSPSAFL